jgi:hypothetical protein
MCQRGTADMNTQSWGTVGLDKSQIREGEATSKQKGQVWAKRAMAQTRRVKPPQQVATRGRSTTTKGIKAEPPHLEPQGADLPQQRGHKGPIYHSKGP